MKYIISGKNMEISPALKKKAVKKMGKLKKFFKPETEVHVTMSIEKNRHIVEVTIPFNGVVIRAEESNNDMYTSIDRVIDIIERQIRKNKTRLQKRIHESALNPDFFESEVKHADGDEEEEFKVVRTKKFAIKPMDVEEAILQMNLIGHEFYMFSNAETNQVNVVYRRKNGDYGLIEPEF